MTQSSTDQDQNAARAEALRLWRRAADESRARYVEQCVEAVRAPQSPIDLSERKAALDRAVADLARQGCTVLPSWLGHIEPPPVIPCFPMAVPASPAVAPPPPDPRLAREQRRREIDDVIAVELRRFPEAAAEAVRAAVVACFEDAPPCPPEDTMGPRHAYFIMKALRSHDRGEPVSNPLHRHAIAAYERVRLPAPLPDAPAGYALPERIERWGLP